MQRFFDSDYEEYFIKLVVGEEQKLFLWLNYTKYY